ncbi:unnamed protein product [Bemisia tabaci]|uniref:Tetraspanin n=1 Tax=Bemisia tabaci TaxID=7038 RepID=A0A9P0F6M5_BEMTA|nr:unnamed protein product [Bemisia tabaci]
MSNCLSCLFKYVVFFFNYILLLIGITVLLISVWLKGPVEYYNTWISGEVSIGQIVLASFCVGVILVSFCGCFGSLKENRCLIILYGISMFLLLVSEIAGFGYSYWNRADIELATKQEVRRLFDTYYVEPTTKNEAIHMVDFLQSQLRCCGFEGIDYWKDLKADQQQSQLPMSCCSNMRARDYKICTESEAYRDGCWQKLQRKWMREYPNVQIGIGVVILIELLALVLSVYLAKAHARKSQKYADDSDTNYY